MKAETGATKAARKGSARASLVTRRIFYIALGPRSASWSCAGSPQQPNRCSPTTSPAAWRAPSETSSTTCDRAWPSAKANCALRWAWTTPPGQQAEDLHPMHSAEIRRRFLAHFESRGHPVVPCASLISEDPTLLLVNAGMVPFKPYFLGDSRRPHARRPACRRCVRTLDIDNVGKTTRHASFFQMCGNFSFGDYFKAGAIPMAWELLTVGREAASASTPSSCGPPSTSTTTRPSRCGPQFLPDERIQRRGKEDNYWYMGVPGPVRSLLRDLLRPRPRVRRRRRPGRRRGPLPRGLEPRLHAVRARCRSPATTTRSCGDLPAKNIDTGLGLERMATILQGVDNLYEIDISRPVLDRAAELTGMRYGARPMPTTSRCGSSPTTSVPARCSSPTASTPTNEGRGYVLRRLLRRALSEHAQAGLARAGRGASCSRACAA